LTSRTARHGQAGSKATGRRRTVATPEETDDIVARAARLGITVERLLKELRCIAFADPSLMFAPDGDGTYRLKPLAEVDPELFPAIQEIVPGDAGHARVKFYDKRPILELLARYIRLLPAAPAADASSPASTDEEVEDPREFLIRELDRLAGKTGAGPADPGTGGGRGPRTSE